MRPCGIGDLLLIPPLGCVWGDTLWSGRCIVDTFCSLCAIRLYGPGDVLLVPPLGCVL